MSGVIGSHTVSSLDPLRTTTRWPVKQYSPSPPGYPVLTPPASPVRVGYPRVTMPCGRHVASTTADMGQNATECEEALSQVFFQELITHTLPSTDGKATPFTAQSYAALVLYFDGIQEDVVDVTTGFFSNVRKRGYRALDTEGEVKWKGDVDLDPVSRLKTLVRLVDSFKQSDPLLFQRLERVKIQGKDTLCFSDYLKKAVAYWQNVQTEKALENGVLADQREKQIGALEERLRRTETSCEIFRAQVDGMKAEQVKAKSDLQAAQQALDSTNESLIASRKQTKKKKKELKLARATVVEREQTLQGALVINQNFVFANRALKEGIFELQKRFETLTEGQKLSHREAGKQGVVVNEQIAYERPIPHREEPQVPAHQTPWSDMAAYAAETAALAERLQVGLCAKEPKFEDTIALANRVLSDGSCTRDVKQEFASNIAERSLSCFKSAIGTTVEAICAAEKMLKKSWWLDGWFAFTQRSKIREQQKRLSELRGSLEKINQIKDVRRIEEELRALVVQARLLENEQSGTRAHTRMSALGLFVQRSLDFALHGYQEKIMLIEQMSEKTALLQRHLKNCAEQAVKCVEAATLKVASVMTASSELGLRVNCQKRTLEQEALAV